MFLLCNNNYFNLIIVPDDKDQKKSQKVLAELENIDDECDQNNIAFVKIDDDEEAKEYGIDALPSMVYFEKQIPHIYDGDLMNEDDLLGWLLHQKRHSEIPEITDEMMEKLLEKTKYMAVLFCKCQPIEFVLNRFHKLMVDFDLRW